MRDCMQFDDAIYKYTISRYAVYEYSSGDVGDEAISESYKYIDVLSIDGSSVHFFPFTVDTLFPPSHAL